MAWGQRRRAVADGIAERTPVTPRLVARSRHHPSWAIVADHNGLAAQLWSPLLLDRRVEGVHVEVSDDAPWPGGPVLGHRALAVRCPAGAASLPLASNSAISAAVR